MHSCPSMAEKRPLYAHCECYFHILIHVSINKNVVNRFPLPLIACKSTGSELVVIMFCLDRTDIRFTSGETSTPHSGASLTARFVASASKYREEELLHRRPN